MQKTAKEILKDARELLSVRERWIKGDEFGPPTTADLPQACMLGALYYAADLAEVEQISDTPMKLWISTTDLDWACYSNLDDCRELIDPDELPLYEAAATLIECARQRIEDDSSVFISTIPDFNDSENTTHADVLAVFDCALTKVAE